MKEITIIFGVISVFLLFMAVALPLLSGDSGSGRLKALNLRREEMRRDATARSVRKNSFRENMVKETWAQRWVKKLDLMRFVDPVTLRRKLMVAGWRNRSSLATFLMFHVILPVGFGGYAAFAVYGGPLGSYFEGSTKHLVVIGATGVGFFIPSILLQNAIQKRTAALSRQFPDALDLMLVSVEAGLAPDMAMMKVTEEIGNSIPEVAEELATTAAELAYLGDRIKALENMATRTGNEDFKALSTVLIQAEKQGSPVADALRIISNEARLKRKNAIEKQAAGLGPKMTVPMILFILPCMFLVLIGPAAIKVMALE
jgi:tight adherence protein C